MNRTCLYLLTAGLLSCSSSSGDGQRSGAIDPSTDPDGSSDGSDDGSDDVSDGDDESPSDGVSDDPPDDGVCEEQGVRSRRITPDILIVLDRSGSMSPGQNNGVDRWGGSVQGIKAVTSALDASVNFGLMTFPSDDSCGPGTTNVPIAPGNAPAIAQALDGMEPGGATPTRDSLEAARAELEAIVPNPDEVARPKYVLLVTDGAPNCSESENVVGDLLACLLAPDPAACTAGVLASAGDQVAVDESVEAIRGLASVGMKTYVIGYNTKSVANLASALDQMAAVGDTGDTEHRAVEDEAELVREFEEITGVAVSCEFALDEAPRDPSYVLVTLDGEQLNLNEPDGWIISEDRKKVTVQGAACDALQNGTKQQLSVKVLCEVVLPE